MRLRYNSRAPVAQLDRASGFEPAGRRFKSCRAHHLLLRAFPDITTASYGTAAPKSKIGRCTEMDRIEPLDCAVHWPPSLCGPRSAPPAKRQAGVLRARYLHLFLRRIIPPRSEIEKGSHNCLG